MGYTNSRYTMKWYYPHTNKIRYCSSEIVDEYKNKFGKKWSPGSELMTGTNIFILLTLKMISQIIPSSKMIYFKLLLNFHQYLPILESLTNNVSITTCPISPIHQKIVIWKHAFLARHRTIACIFSIGIK